MIRIAREDDAERLREIYAYYVEHTAVSFEYEVPPPEEFRQRMRRTLLRYPYLVAEDGGRILGYAYAGAFKERRAYDWSVETTVYVDRAARRQGIGRALYAALEQALTLQGIVHLDACIACPPGGAADEFLTGDSAAFHARAGFTAVGRFPLCGCKFGRWYDMIWMEKNLSDVPPVPPPPIRLFPEIRGELAQQSGLR